jgi:hypothetical protein
MQLTPAQEIALGTAAPRREFLTPADLVAVPHKTVSQDCQLVAIEDADGSTALFVWLPHFLHWARWTPAPSKRHASA